MYTNFELSTDSAIVGPHAGMAGYRWYFVRVGAAAARRGPRVVVRVAQPCRQSTIALSVEKAQNVAVLPLRTSSIARDGRN